MKLLQQRLERIAADYAQHAFLADEIGERLLQRLQFMNINPQLIVNLGAGFGRIQSSLNQHFSKATSVAVDFNKSLLKNLPRKKLFYKQPAIMATPTSIPLQTAVADLVIANLSFGFCQDSQSLFKEIRRVLKPGGLCLFATLGPDTLKELRWAWAQVDEYDHVTSLKDMHDFGDEMVRAKLADPVTDMECLTLTYPHVNLLLTELKQQGFINFSDNKQKTLLGKNKFRQMQQHYQQQFVMDKKVMATFEIIYGHCWGTDALLNSEVNEKGEVFIPLRNVLGLRQ